MPNKLFTSLLNPSLKVTEDQLETDVNILNMERAVLAMNRRAFMGSLVATGAIAAVGSTALALRAEAQSSIPSGLGALTNVLNFALNLEYLEANFYIAASGGAPLSDADTGGTTTVPTLTPMGLPTGLALDAPTMALATALAADERNHIEQLRAAITANQGTPIVQPQIDYAMGGTMPVTTQAQFLAIARQFTAVGNSAYSYAAYLLYGVPSLLTAAAQILGAEGQHLGAVNYQCVLQGVKSAAVDTLDVPPSSTPVNFFTITPTNTSFYPTQPSVPSTPTPTPVPTVLAPTGPALGIIRSPQDVLGIVYGATTSAMNQPPSTGIAKGGFFPAGVNGSITTT